MPVSIEEGSLLRVSVWAGGYTESRKRVIRVGKKGHMDGTAVPPILPIDSEMVSPFLNQEIGAEAVIEGSPRMSQFPEYFVTLEAVLPPNSIVREDEVDSFQH